jgi:hypothetical protein
MRMSCDNGKARACVNVSGMITISGSRNKKAPGRAAECCERVTGFEPV